MQKYLIWEKQTEKIYTKISGTNQFKGNHLNPQIWEVLSFLVIGEEKKLLQNALENISVKVLCPVTWQALFTVS